MREVHREQPKLPRRGPGSVTEMSAMNYVREVFNKMHWTAVPMEQGTDFGIDLNVDTFKDIAPHEKLPWTFQAQVKGSRRPHISRGQISWSVPSAHIRSWILGDLPVLLVLCELAGDVPFARCTWADEYVYSTLGWPIADESSVVPRSVTIKLAASAHFTRESMAPLLTYLKDWSPPRRTADHLMMYKRNTRDTVLRESDVRSKIARWSLFALPLTYERIGSFSDRSIIRSEVRPPEFPDRCVALLGKPASGKTVTVKRVMAFPPGNSIPIRINDALLASTGALTKQTLFEYVMRTVGISSERHVGYIEQRGDLIIILDGLNQFRNRDGIADAISSVAREMPTTTFLITCRTAEYKKLRGFKEWAIVDLDDKAQRWFLKCQPRETQRTVTAAFRRQPDLQQECRNPFLFLLAVQLIPELGSRSLDRVELYRRFLQRYLTWVGVERSARSGWVRLLAKIAFSMRKSRTERTAIQNSHLSKFLRSEPELEDPDWVRNRLYEYGLIEKRGRYSRFIQETLQEYLCAFHLVESGVLPYRFVTKEGGFYYDSVEISGPMMQFYIALAGFSRIAAGARQK